MCKFPSSYLANCHSSTLFVWCAFFYIVILYIVNKKEIICTEMYMQYMCCRTTIHPLVSNEPSSLKW